MDNCFVKKSHVSHYERIFSLAAVFAVVVILLVESRGFSAVAAVVICALIAIFAAAFVKLKDTYGLYIKDGSLYYKTFRYKAVNPKDITAIKILEERIHSSSYPSRHHSSDVDDKNSNESSLCRAFYLNKVNDKIKNFKGEEKSFISRFGENIMFVTVYDEDAVKEIMEMNPDIQLIN